MAHDLATLQAMRDRLQSERGKGVRKYEIDGQAVEFRSDSELRTAIADLDRQINELLHPRRRSIPFLTSKGL